MISSPPGIATSMCEVTNVSRFGFWIIVNDREFFVPFADYPGFCDATMTQIYAVEHVAPDQLHWPALDVDIDLNALAHPETFPLIFR